jgi:ribosomal protein S12 methylthiotransferase accessory factor YcaO
MPWIERRWEAIRVASTSWQIGELQLFKEGVVIQAQHKHHDHCKTLRWVRAMDVMNL